MRLPHYDIKAYYANTGELAMHSWALGEFIKDIMEVEAHKSVGKGTKLKRGLIDVFNGDVLVERWKRTKNDEWGLEDSQ
jgi:hypothetical protein